MRIQKKTKALPTKDGASSPSSTRTESLATLVADIQHILKAVQDRDQTGRTGLQIIRKSLEKILRTHCLASSHSEKSTKIIN